MKIIESLTKTVNSYQKKADGISTDYGNANLTHRRARQLAENQRKADNFLKVVTVAKELIQYHTEQNIKNIYSKISTGSQIEFLLFERFPDPIKETDAEWVIKEKKRKFKILTALNISIPGEFEIIKQFVKELSEAAPKTGDSFSETAILLKHPSIRNIPGFFPTPKPLIDKMIDLAEYTEDGLFINWEPSAGFGSIADAIVKATNDPGKVNIKVCELNTDLAKILMDKGYNVVANDMHDMVQDKHSRLFGYFTRILMNPPFENNQAPKHIQFCYKVLRKDGRLISIMDTGWLYNNNSVCADFRKWIGWNEDLSYSLKQGPVEILSDEKRVVIEMNPEGSFKSAFNKTNISTLMLLIDRYELANS